MVPPLIRRVEHPVLRNDFEVKYLRIELEGLKVEVIDVGERVRSLEGLLVTVSLLHRSSLDLGRVLAVCKECAG